MRGPGVHDGRNTQNSSVAAGSRPYAAATRSTYLGRVYSANFAAAKQARHAGFGWPRLSHVPAWQLAAGYNERQVFKC